MQAGMLTSDTVVGLSGWTIGMYVRQYNSLLLG